MSTVRLSIGNSSYSISSSNTTGGESYVSANGLFMDFTGTWVSESNTSVQIKVTDYYVENSTTKDYWFKVKNPSGTTSDLIRINKGNYRAFTPNWTLTWNKTHSAQTGVDKPWYIYWYTDSAGKNLDRTWTIHIYGDISAKPSYAVKYNANGGSPTPGAQTKWYGENLTLASAISKANSTTTYTVTLKGNGISDPAALKATKTTKYTFAGWNTNSSGTGTGNYSAGGTYSANSAITLYAKFTSSSTTSSVTFPSPTRSGYTFGGWGTTNTATTAAYAGGAKLTPTQDVTYHAIWKRTITYNGNVPSGVSVSNVPSPATSVASSNTTIASGSGNTPTRTGYLFKGWASSPSANTAEYQPGDNYAANKPSVTLYAVWQSTVTVGSLVSVRCNQSGTPDDEGTYALLTLPWSTDSAASNTPTASFSITDEDGNPITVSTLSLSGHSGTISKLVAGFNTEKQYDIAITVSETTQGGSATARDILSRAYFTMDVLGDAYYDYETHTGPRPGHGIAFGSSATDESFTVAMPAKFKDELTRMTDVFDASKANNNITATIWPPAVSLHDAGNRRTLFLGNSVYADGHVASSLFAYNYNTSGESVGSNYLSITIGKDGSKTYGVGDPTNFRNAIGASSGVWPVAQGGTGISNFFTVKNANGSTTSVSSSPSSYPRLASISLEAGTWLVVVGCYSASGTGSRVWALSNATSMSSVPGRGNTVQLYATASSVYLPMIWTVSPSATTTYYVYGWQNTGSALNMSAYVFARKMS